MKSYEQMTKDVLKRRDEQLKSSMKFRSAAQLAVPCASMAAIVGIVCGVSTYADRKTGAAGSQPGEMVSAGDSGYIHQAIGSPDVATSNNSVAILPIDPEGPDYTNPKSGQNDIHILEVGKFNSDSGVETDPADFDPYTMELLCRFYNLEFDRLTKLHSSWGLQHEPLGIYKRQSSDGFSVKLEMYGTRNTLNYTTEKGATISVSAQYPKFAPLSTEMFAEDKPFEPTLPESYDPAASFSGSFSGAVNPNTNDEGVSLVNGYDAYIYRDSNGNFAADINMVSRVRFIATGLSEEEFLEVIDEYTKNITEKDLENKTDTDPQKPDDPDPAPENPTPGGTSTNEPEKIPENDPETVPQKPLYDNSGLYPEISKEELKSAIDAFPLNEITLPDGSKVSKYQAVYGNATAETLTFPFAFYRIASPIYKTTVDDPNLVRFVDGKWEATIDTDALVKEIDRTYKKAAPGDVIENGLTVSGAVCTIDSCGDIQEDTLCFDGEITLSGELNYLPEEDMGIAPYTMWFRPDSVKAQIPELYKSKEWVGQYWDGFRNGENDPPFYMYFDSGAWNLGNINDRDYVKFDFDGVFGDKTTVIKTLTVSDIKMDSLYDVGSVSGKIVDIK